MAYEFTKANGRASIFKNGEFDHQQFRSHWAYRNPKLYIEKLIERDRDAAEYAAMAEAAERAEIMACIEDAKPYDTQLDLL